MIDKKIEIYTTGTDYMEEGATDCALRVSGKALDVGWNVSWVLQFECLSEKEKRHFRPKKKHVQRQVWQLVSEDSSRQFILFLYAYIGLPCYPKVELSYENFCKLKWHETKMQLLLI